jgi:four helix bundle protein
MGLRVLDEIVGLSPRVSEVVRDVRGHNRELALQLERAWTRVACGAAEGQTRRGDKGRNRFDDALGEAKEAHGVLRVVFACSYSAVDDELLQRVDGVAAVLYRLAHRRR